MDQTEHAVVHETIEAAKTLQPKSPVGFFNGVLRNALRKRDGLRERLKRASASDRYSHPAALVKQWYQCHDEKRVDQWMEWNNRKPDLWIRLASHHSLENYLRQLQEAGVEHHVGHDAPGQWIRISQSCSVTSLPGFAEGAFYVQDPSTAYAPHMLEAKSHEIIGDVCAAPGGKAGILAEGLGADGRLILSDVHADRLRLLQQNLERIRCESAQVVEANLLKEEGVAMLRGVAVDGFDALLLDVPCSNTGVLRRRPEARWHLSTDRMARLLQTQAEMLDRSVDLVKPGGRVVYSTCSIEVDENQSQVVAFLERSGSFELEEEVALYPGEQDCDGCYAARLRRNK